MTVATFVQPNFTAQLGSTYKGNIDAAIAALVQLAGNFAPHQAATPNMTVVVDAGRLWSGWAVLEKSQQTTATITAPTTNPRIDRIVLDPSNGNTEIVTGTEAASPTAPAIASGRIPVARVSLTVGQTSIVNANITDERLFSADNTVRGALVYPSGTQSIANASDVPLDFDTEAYDTNSIHDTVTNNSRLVVPSGVTKVRLTGNLELASGTGLRSLSIKKNGSNAIGLPRIYQRIDTSDAWVGNVNSGVINVAAGDYFQLIARHSAGVSINTSVTNSHTWFAMEIVQ